MRDEIRADAEEFGDARRSPLVVAVAAQALSESELTPSEPVTVVLSVKGWARAAKGHDVDPAALAYREGDAAHAAVRGRSNQQAIFFDSTGRAYATPAHALPSARGHGEPLTGRFALPAGARFEAVTIGDDEAKVVIATSHGYGFVAPLSAFASRNKAGKTAVSLTAGARVLQPAATADVARDRIVAVTTQGHLLMFSVADLPELERGKGNKLIEVPKARLASGDETVAGIAVVREGGEVLVYSGQRFLRMKWADLVAYQGNRAQRGSKLPRGFQRVDRIAPA